MAGGFSDFLNPRIRSVVCRRCENEPLSFTICPNTAPLFFHFCRCNTKILTTVAAKNIRSDHHIGTIVILPYVEDSLTNGTQLL